MEFMGEKGKWGFSLISWVSFLPSLPLLPWFIFNYPSLYDYKSHNRFKP